MVGTRTSEAARRVRGEFYPGISIPFAARSPAVRLKLDEDRGRTSSPPTMPATSHASWRSLDADGTILALRGHAQADVGASYPHQWRDRRTQHRFRSCRDRSRSQHPHAGVAPRHQQDPVGTIAGQAVQKRTSSRAAVRHGGNDLGTRPRRIPPPQHDRRREMPYRSRASSSSTSRPRLTAAIIESPSRAPRRDSAGPPVALHEN